MRADLVHVDGRLLRFDVVAEAADGTLLGHGQVTRVVVDRAGSSPASESGQSRAVGDQLDVRLGIPVPLRRADEAEPLVDPVRRVHDRQRAQDHGVTPVRPGPVDAPRREGLADTATSGRGRDGEHPELGLAVAGHLGPRRTGPAVGDGAEHRPGVVVHGDGQLGVPGPVRGARRWSA